MLRVDSRPTQLIRCPYCHADLEPGAEVVTCGHCLTGYHAGCGEERSRCSLAGCEGRLDLPTASRWRTRDPQEPLRRVDLCRSCEERVELEDRQPCAGCQRVHHRHCLQANAGCANSSCARPYPEPAQALDARLKRAAEAKANAKHKPLLIGLTLLLALVWPWITLNDRTAPRLIQFLFVFEPLLVVLLVNLYYGSE